MNQNELAREQPNMNRILAILISGVLWVLVLVLSMSCLFALRELLIWFLALILPTPDPDSARRIQAANLINVVVPCAFIVMGLIDMVFIVYISEHFFSRAGQARLNRFLLKIIAVQCLIVLPVAWFFWLA
jgi:hypothetical protein